MDSLVSSAWPCHRKVAESRGRGNRKGSQWETCPPFTLLPTSSPTAVPAAMGTPEKRGSSSCAGEGGCALLDVCVCACEWVHMLRHTGTYLSPWSSDSVIETTPALLSAYTGGLGGEGRARAPA